MRHLAVAVAVLALLAPAAAAEITPAMARDAIEAELARRHGERFTASPRREVRCLRRAIEPAYPGPEDEGGHPERATCAYEFDQDAERYRSGALIVSFPEGRAEFIDVFALVLPVGLRSCGSTDFSRNRWGPRWLHRPFPPEFGGAMLSVWAQRIPCAEARRLAYGNVQRRRRAAGFRCLVTAKGYESRWVRCTASGGRILRWEIGA